MDVSGIRLTCAIGVLVGCAGALADSPRAYEGRPIQAIEFEPAVQPAPVIELLPLLPLSVGDALQLSAVRLAIAHLWATQMYTDIAADVRRVPGGVALRFLTQKNWFISAVTVEGVPAPPTPSQLARTTKLELGTPFTEEGLEAAVRNLQENLRDSGFYEATVQPVVKRAGAAEEVNLVFEVDAGPRALFSRPLFSGDPKQTEEKLTSSTRWRRLLPWPDWRPMTEARLQEGLDRIRRSYQKRNLLMAKIQLEGMRYDAGSKSVTPAIRVDAGPRVRIEVAGAKVSRGKLKELVPVFQEQSVDGSLLVEGRRNLVEHFQSRGYFDAQAGYTTAAGEAGEQVIRYTVERGVRHKISEVRIEGNRYFDQGTIRERLYTTPATTLRFRHGRFSRPGMERDRGAIAELYRTNGFPDAEVTAEVLQRPRGRAAQEAVVFRIRENDQWLVRSLDLSGVDLKIYDQVLALLQSTAGQPYSASNVAADRDSLLGYYHNNGYPDTSLEVTSTPDPKTRRVDLRYVVREGRRLYVRNVLAGGLRSTNPDLVANRIRVAPGEAFSQSAIIESQRRLYDLGIFAKVDVGLQNPDGRTRSKNVLYQLEEARKYSFSGGFGAEMGRIGGGITSFDAPGGSAGFSPRVSLGVSRSNFFGIGHTMGLQTLLSNYQRRGLLTYLAPQFIDNENLSLTLTALYDDSRNVRTFSARRFEGAAQLSQRLSRASTVQYRLAFRHVSVDSSTLKIEPQLIDLLSQPVRVGQISASFIQDRRDDPIDPRRGVYSSLDLGWATKALTSQSDFVRLLGRNSTYHSIGRDWVIARATTFGSMGDLGGREIPLPERFFGGGATSHRGFPENQAGPRDPVTGFPLGGRALLVNQVEARFPLIGDTVGAVLFHDAGNVYQSLARISLRLRQRDASDFSYMIHAVGSGLRYRTPIGPIRVDLAYSINSPRFIGFQGTRQELLEGRGQRNVPQRISRFQFHFSLGQSF
ncbi:MAG: BamA/TamA family outer membrane protein [Acidobacteria bacterium]|nr:BamA/TamA family outer membrane protein [Acidobacteriota bacterium]